MTTNRSSQISKVYKVLKKHYKPVAPPADRTGLEHLIYACLLENARYELADESFARLKELFFDWNEVRVTTVTELAEGMTGIPDAAAAAQRVKRSLQSIFEANYSFDIESMKKQNLGKAEKDLERINGATSFVRAYMTQNALGGHCIPVSKGAIDVLHAVGVISDQEADKGLVPGLERAIPKNKGVEFASLLQQVGADLAASPGSSKLKSVLAEMDPDFKDRLAERQARVEAAEAAAAVAAKEARTKARAEAKAAAAELKAPPRPAPKETQKAAGKLGPESARSKDKEKDLAKHKPVTPPVKAKPDSAAQEKESRQATAKGLVKKKPR